MRHSWIIVRGSIGDAAGSFKENIRRAGSSLLWGRPSVSHFHCTGMHGGKLYLRPDGSGLRLPGQVKARPAGVDDLTVITPDTKNPYRQMYVLN